MSLNQIWNRVLHLTCHTATGVEGGKNKDWINHTAADGRKDSMIMIHRWNK